MDAGSAEVLQDSNRVVLRILPADAVARIHVADRANELLAEIDLAQRLRRLAAPIGLADPRFELRPSTSEGCAMTFWRHYAQVPQQTIAADAYATRFVAFTHR